MMKTPEDILVSFLSDLSLSDFDPRSLLEYGIPSLLLMILNKDAVVLGDQSLIASTALKNLYFLLDDSQIRDQIVKECGLDTLSRIVKESTCDIAISYSAKALGEIFKGKSESNGSTALISLMNKLECPSISEECKSSIVSALANASLVSEANKVFISSKITATDVPVSSKSNECVSSICAMVMNSAYCNTSAAYNFLESGTVELLVSHGKHMIENIGENFLVIERMLDMLTNLSNSRQNQSLVESIEDAIPFVTEVLLVAEEPSLLNKACRACASICYFTNSARRDFGKECLTTLTDIILRMGLYNDTDEDEAESATAIEACKALSSLVADDLMKEQFLDNNMQDIRSLIQLFLETESNEVIIGGAMIVSILLPSSRKEQNELIAEGRLSFIENENGKAVLQRCAKECHYDDLDLQPQWLRNAIELVFVTPTQAVISKDICNVKLQRREKSLDEYFSLTKLFVTTNDNVDRR